MSKKQQIRDLMLRSGSALGILLLSGSITLVEAQEPKPQAPEMGLWYDDSGRGAVEISPCGNQLCGHIVWLHKTTDSQGRPLHDKYNPEPQMRNRPICGIQVLGNLNPQGDGSWGAGWVYDPKVGKSYDVEIKLANANTLTVFGYAGVKLFGKKLVWKRAPADLPKCDSPLPASVR
ncbi:MAG: DUF2147 domain-containing protein [Filomicrobium sp.]